MTRESIPAGETLRDDLDALGMGAAELARRVEEPVNRISEIVIGRRAWGASLGRRRPATRGQCAAIIDTAEAPRVICARRCWRAA